MDNVVTQEVFKRIDALAEKMGTTAAYMWPRLVAYTKGVAVAEIIIVGGLFLAAAIVFCVSLKHGAKDDWNDSTISTTAIVSGILSVLLLIAVLVGGPDSISRAFSPEAAAFYKLVGK